MLYMINSNLMCSTLLFYSAPCIPLCESALLRQKHTFDTASKMKIWNNIFMLTICNGFSNLKVKFKRTYINDIKFQWFMYMKLNKIGRNIVKQFLNRIYERMREGQSYIIKYNITENLTKNDMRDHTWSFSYT